jgi:hypothetical protein
MGISSLERVLWRLRESKHNSVIFTNKELRLAIMREVGTDPRTLKRSRDALKDLGWIKAAGTNHIRLTNDDIVEV